MGWDLCLSFPRVCVDGWEVSIYNDCNELDYCEERVNSDGRRW